MKRTVLGAALLFFVTPGQSAVTGIIERVESQNIPRSIKGIIQRPPELTTSPVVKITHVYRTKVIKVEPTTEPSQPVLVVVPNDREPPEAEEQPQHNQPVVTFDMRPPAQLLDEAKALLVNRNGPYDVAINNLRSIILTRPVDEAREAHEILGYAYEKSKMFEKAKIEYALYLSLYKNDDDDRTRVRQRLMSLEILEPTESVNVGVDKKPRQGNSSSLTGTVSEYAYVGSTSPSAKLFDWNNDQLHLLSGIQLGYKNVHDQYILSGKFRLNVLNDLLHSRGSRTNLSTAYVDFEDTFLGYNVRVGRQPPLVGAISRYDGISGHYSFDDRKKLIIALGYPFSGRGNNTSRFFEGLEFDWKINNDFSTGIYFNRQTADGFLERLALGTDIHYVDNNNNLTARLEYDFAYGKINVITLQGIHYFKGTDVFALFERRKSPLLFADVALGLGGLSPEHQAYNTVGQLINQSGLSNSEIYSYISNSTPYATSFVIGGSKVLNKKWSATADFQMSNISTIPGFSITPNFDPYPITTGIKNNYTINLHLKGEDFLKENNSSEIVLSRTTGELGTYFVTLTDSYRYGDDNRNSISLILRGDLMNRSYGKTESVSAILRSIYKLSEHGVLEGQYARVLIYSPSVIDSPYSTNQTFYIGYRYDF